MHLRLLPLLVVDCLELLVSKCEGVIITLSISRCSQHFFLCSAVPTTPAAGGSLFGSTTTPAPAAGGLFGAPGEFCSYAALLDSLCSRL